MSCKEEYGVQTPVNTPAIDVTTQKLEPAADEAGSVRAYIGTEVTAHGLNLELVSKVTVDDAEAEIVTKEFKTLVFKVPTLPLAQNDDPPRTSLQKYWRPAATPPQARTWFPSTRYSQRTTSAMRK